MLTVIIFTHNPRRDYLLRVLRGLEDQTLPKDQWELIVVDNASNELLSERFDIAWHPSARHVREDQVGLTPARLKGIRESKGNLLVFVDDDNVLHPTYLETALGLANSFPFLGTFGGQVHAVYECPPTPEVTPFLHYLLDRRVTVPRWGRDNDYHRFSPCGAGMAVRREVAQRFVEKLSADARRIGLGRKGEQLFSGEDSDLALCSHDLKMGNGVFPELVLDHLIPSSRLEPSFFIRVARAGAFSEVLLRYLNGLDYSNRPISPLFRLKRFVQSLTTSPLARKVEAAHALGRREALAKIAEWEAQ